MSAEHIMNQSHIKHQELRNQALNNPEAVLKNKELTPQTNKVTGVETQQFLQSTEVQKLLSQQSDVARQNLMKKSVEFMVEKGQIRNEELEQEINQELNKFFKPNLKMNDETSISKEYLLNQRKETEPNKNEASKFIAAKQHNQNKSNKIKEQRVESYVNEEVSDEADDFVQIKTKQQSKETKQTQTQQSQSLLQQKDVKQYAQLVSQYAINQQPNTKYELKKLQQHLLQRGLTTTQINHMGTKVGQVIKQHMMYDLKQQLINFHMSKGFSKQMQAQESVAFNNSSRLLEQMRSSNRLTTDINDVVDKLRHQAKQDLGNFLFEESAKQFTKHSLGQISLDEFTEELNKLQKAAASAGVNISERDLENKIFSAIDHLGLGEFTKPNTDSNQNQKEPEKIITPEEALDDKLRYLYMIKALHPSLRHKVDIHFKMKKCRNGMIKLGFYTDEKEDALKKQGEFLAATQFKEELCYVFREEATLANLSGSEYGVLRKKKAFYLSQLRKVNHGLKQEEIDKIKEKMYREMYGLIKEEILQLEEIAEVTKHISVTRKLKHLKEVVERITESVQIDDFTDVQQRLIKPKEQSLIDEGV